MSKNNDGDDGSRDADPCLDTLVCVTEGKPMADSRVIAKKFGKRHDNVLRDIDRLMEAVNSLGPQNRGPRFVERNAANPTIPSLSDRYFDLDRTAFALLTFGFTGTEALRWKLAFIQVFEAMEAELAQADATRLAPPKAPDAHISGRNRTFENVLAEPGLSPDVLLNLLFENKIPETGHPTFRFFATDACAALGIARAEVPIALARIPETERTVLSVETQSGPAKRDAITEPALYILAFTPGAALPNTIRKSISFLGDFHDFFDGKALSHHIKLVEISWMQLKAAFMDLFPGHPALLQRTEKAVQAAVDEADQFLRRHGEGPKLPSDPGDLTRH